MNHHQSQYIPLSKNNEIPLFQDNMESTHQQNNLNKHNMHRKSSFQETDFSPLKNLEQVITDSKSPHEETGNPTKHRNKAYHKRSGSYNQRQSPKSITTEMKSILRNTEISMSQSTLRRSKIIIKM